MTPHPFDHVAFVLLAAIFPIRDYFFIRKRAARINAGEAGVRLGFYRRVIGEQWATALVLLVVWFALGRDATSIGFVPRLGLHVWAGYVLTAVICATLIFQAVTVVRDPKSLATVRGKLASLSFLLPRTPRERRAFDAVSVTAGICEEILYRGFAVVYLMAAFGAPFWVAGLLSSLVFGVAHAYQGVAGASRSALVGLMLFLLYALTGSLWGPMLVHAVLDITSGRIGYAAYTETPAPRVQPPGTTADSIV
jgi:membrane protease YdiL (CAAX protease family)